MNKKYFYNTISQDFTKLKNSYDTLRRKKILIDQYLNSIIENNLKIVDCGCADGYFTNEIYKLNKQNKIYGLDISENMIKINQSKYKNINFFISDIEEINLDKKYDIVFSSEVIEHCSKPINALNNLLKIVDKNGYIIFSTPNILWLPVVKLATLFKLRKFNGLENFLSYNSIKDTLNSNNFKIVNFRGIHLYPFQFGFNNFHEKIDNKTTFFNKFKINFCFIAKRIN